MSNIIFETIISGIFVASAFPIGAWIAVSFDYSTKLRSLFATFGAGLFLATTMLLVQDSLSLGNFADLILGFAVGASAFGLAQHFLKHKLEKENKTKTLQARGRLSIIGTLLDSFPETIFIGVIIALREPGLFAAEAVLFMGNLATTLEGAKIMHKQGIERKMIMREWLADSILVAIAAPIGYFLAKNIIQDVVAIVLGFAAGTLIVFIAGELISRAYRESTGHAEDFSISVGFLVGIMLLFVLG
ncbi:MAG: ZIP family metal transporter [Betaproteobacteria bacterium]